MRQVMVRKPAGGILIPIGLSLGLVVLGADIVPLALRPLRSLGIPFPTVLSYAHLLAPAAAAAVWLSALRKFPTLGAVGGIVLWVLLINGVVRYAEHRTASIPTTRFLTQDEQQALASRFPYLLWQQASTGRGNEILIERNPERVRRLTEELRAMNVLRALGHPP